MNEITQYVVRISYSNTPIGSGVIIKPQQESKDYYVLTASHVINKCAEQTDFDLRKLKAEHIKGSTIIEFFFKETIVSIDVGKIRDEEDGILILALDENRSSKEYLSKLYSIKIIRDHFNKCVIAGYPAFYENKELESYICTYKKISHDNDDAYEVYSETPVNMPGRSENSSLEGLSGAGVFLTEPLGLVGIQVQTKECRLLVCIDLTQGIAEDINSALSKKNLDLLQLNGFSFFEKLDVDDKKLDFNLLNSELDKDYIRESATPENIRRLKRELNEKKRLLADSCLSLGLKFHQEGDNRRATNYFKTAIEHCPSHELYFLKAKNLRGIKKNIAEYLTETEDSSKKIELIESIIKINEEDKNILELVDSYLALLNIYESNADIYLTYIRDTYFKLGKLFSKTDYKKCKGYIEAALNTNADTPTSEILYNCLIKSAYHHKKYDDAVLLCNKVLNLPDKNIENIISIYNALIKLTYLQDENNPQIYVYLKEARNYLSKLEKNSKSYKILSSKIKKSWLQISSHELDDLRSVGTNLLSTINNLKSDNETIKHNTNKLMLKLSEMETYVNNLKNNHILLKKVIFFMHNFINKIKKKTLAR